MVEHYTFNVVLSSIGSLNQCTQENGFVLVGKRKRICVQFLRSRQDPKASCNLASWFAFLFD
jgi:hypothetical protein